MFAVVMLEKPGSHRPRQSYWHPIAHNVIHPEGVFAVESTIERSMNCPAVTVLLLFDEVEVHVVVDPESVQVSPVSFRAAIVLPARTVNTAVVDDGAALAATVSLFKVQALAISNIWFANSVV